MAKSWQKVHTKQIEIHIFLDIKIITANLQ